MIRLKHLLFEDSDTAVNRTRVLFVGDQDTLAANSYARQLIKRKDISGRIAAKIDASLMEMYELVRNMLTKKYAVVSFFYDPNVQKEVADIEETIILLENIFQYIKNHHECTLVVIVPPLKHIEKTSDRSVSDKEIRKWLLEQDISDVLIDIGKLERIEFSKQRNVVNINIQRFIKKQWIQDVIGKTDVDDDSTEEESEQEPFSRSKFKPAESDVHIKYLQQHLMSLGYLTSMPISGTSVYDDATISAIKMFQRDNGLAETGEYDYQTRHILKRNLDVETMDDEWRLKNILKPKPIRKKIVGQQTNGQAVMEFFIDKGLSKEGAAGIAGNIQRESSFNTAAVGDNGTSRGLAQWHNDRWTGPEGFETWCNSKGYDPWSVEGQLEFFWWELSTKYISLTNELKDSNITPEHAAYRFAKVFERPTVIEPIRMENARNLYDEFDDHPWIPGF